MPRDGSHIYNVPAGTHGAPNTTIQSAPYNTYVDDVAQDLNAPRPIVAGGTGANNAIDAINNLGGEIAHQKIVNFDSDPLSSGSFYSLTTATGAPISAHAFAGWIYKTDNDNMVIQARDASDTSVPGRLYVREKKGGVGTGVWGTWKLDGRAIIGNAEGFTVDDMFFGVRTLSGTSSFIINNKGDVSGTDILTVTKPGPATFTGTVQANGNLYTMGEMYVGYSGANSGVIRFGTGTSNYLFWDGTKFNFNGALSVAGSVTATGGLTANPQILNANASAITDGTNYLIRTAGSVYFQNNGGGTWGLVNGGGLAMSVGGISTPGNISANSVQSANWFMCTGGSGTIYLNGANNRYLTFDGSNYHIPSSYIYNDGAAGRLWGSNDFGPPGASGFLTNGRLVYAGVYVPSLGGGAGAVLEPFAGAVISGFVDTGADSYYYRFRYMQLFSTGWFTVGYAG